MGLDSMADLELEPSARVRDNSLCEREREEIEIETFAWETMAFSPCRRVTNKKQKTQYGHVRPVRAKKKKKNKGFENFGTWMKWGETKI